MPTSVNSSFHVFEPRAGVPLSPLVFDSPHSCRDWPLGGTPVVAPPEALLTSWDAYMDELWAYAAAGRAPVVAAKFHRAFIDVNRARDDIDLELIDGAWSEPVHMTKKSAAGMGLIRRFALPGVPVYARRLPAQEVRQRLADYYDPYHAEVARRVACARARSGFVCHVDCHSMKSVGNAMNDDSGQARPDIVVSDREGTTAHHAFTSFVARTLSELGFAVKVNDPYKGAELIRRHGLPAQGQHSVQIEINRAIYIDEKTGEKHGGFERLAEDMRVFVDRLIQALDGELGEQLRARGANA